jgi:hypothetical protein
MGKGGQHWEAERGDTKIANRRGQPVNGGERQICYNAQTTVDARNKPVAECEVANDGNGKNRIAPMDGRAKTVLKTDKLAVVADTGYGSARDIVESIAEREGEGD